MNRRLGGLEIHLDPLDATLGVNRRVGGLEIRARFYRHSFIVNRRVGGLKKGELPSYDILRRKNQEALHRPLL